MKTPLKSKVDSRRGVVELELNRPDEEAFLRAAYLMTDRAYAALGLRGSRRTAILWPKKRLSLASLAADFKVEYDNQLLRLAVARHGLGIRAEVLHRALAAAAKAGPASRLAASLPAARREEIEQLLAEAAQGPRDPLGIAAPWDESRRTGA